jgi:hypothetical protein
MLIFKTPNSQTNGFKYSGREVYEIPKSFGLSENDINFIKDCYSDFSFDDT